MEIGHLLETLIELSYFAHTDTWVLCEQSETFGVGIKITDILEVFIDCIHRFLFGSSNEKDCCISTFNSVFLSWWLVVWNRVSHFDITNRECGVKRFVNCFGSLFRVSITPRLFWGIGGFNWGCFDWFWSWFRGGGFDNFFNNVLWLGKVFIVGGILSILLTLLFSELSSLYINKLYIINSLSHSQVGWSGKRLG